MARSDWNSHPDVCPIYRRDGVRSISRMEEKLMEHMIPTPGDLLADPCTPFWAQRLIKELMDKDALDAAQVLAVLAQSFGARAHKLLKGVK
jgi:hypothetical protein